MMREVALHFAIDRVDLLDVHDMAAFPDDVPDRTVPIIVCLSWLMFSFMDSDKNRIIALLQGFVERLCP